MNRYIYILIISIVFISCNFNTASKEKELELKEKILILKQQQAYEISQMEEKIKKDQYEFAEEIKKEKKGIKEKDRISYLRMKEELIKSIEQKKGHIEYLERWLEQEKSPENEGKVNKDRIEYLEKLIEDVKAGKVDPQGQEMKDLQAKMLSDIDRHIEGTP